MGEKGGQKGTVEFGALRTTGEASDHEHSAHEEDATDLYDFSQHMRFVLTDWSGEK